MGEETLDKEFGLDYIRPVSQGLWGLFLLSYIDLFVLAQRNLEVRFSFSRLCK